MALMVLLCASVILLGSCDEKTAALDFDQKAIDITQMDKKDLLSYIYQLQVGLVQYPEKINKLRHRDILLALAEPDLDRKEGPSRVWQYRTAECVLDIYWSDNTHSLKIKHHEFRVRQIVTQKKRVTNNAPPSWQCMQKLVQERQARISESLSERYASL